jgi:LDH2 family malate/lactate/ureidoglycolate dehydrogenase
VLTGAAFGGEVRNPFKGLDESQNTGHFFLALKADLFMPMDSFVERMQVLAERVRSQPLADGFDEILTPGEPEARCEKIRLANGIPLTADVIESLQQEAEQAGVPFPSM